MLFGKSEGEAWSVSYWLATKVEPIYNAHGEEYLRYQIVVGAQEDSENYYGLIKDLYNNGEKTFGVRAVVSLKSDITPTLKSTDSTTGISTYEI